MDTTAKFTCTRPRLASLLMAKGYKCSILPNPYHPERKFWEFDLTPDLAAIVFEYFQKIGKPAPENVKQIICGEN